MAYISKILPVADGGTGVSTLTGIAIGNGTSALTGVTITGTANQISVTNGNGTGGNPTLALTSTIYVSGISFDSGSNTLSAYASGTFTPAITGSGSNPTVGYSSQVGYYQKVGTKVTINANITVSSVSGGSGNAQFSSLPFTSLNVSNANSTCSIFVSNTTYGTSVTYYQGSISPNSTLVLPIGMVSASTTVQLAVSGITSTSQYAYSGDYNI